MKVLMLNVVLAVLSLSLFSSFALADEVCDAQGIYERLDAETSGDMSRCVVDIKEPKIRNCPLPKNYSAGERTASHVVLLMDASGSMAGKLGGKSKISIAKRESLRFLDALQKDVPVGMIVYGHKGNNTKKGKAESCSSVEWVHELGARKSALKKGINELKAVGYTPMGDALDFTLTELSKIRQLKKDEGSVPIVYLLSDGKETCGGDPVASAKALHESGVKAVVNVIGFDVSKETRDQLEAISEAGGGKYFPAKDAKTLRDQLNAAHNTELSLLQYKRCQFFNLSAVAGVHNRAYQEGVACYTREAKRKTYGEIQKNLKAMVVAGDITKQCAEKSRVLAYLADAKNGKWLLEMSKEIKEHQKIELKKIGADSLYFGTKKK